MNILHTVVNWHSNNLIVKRAIRDYSTRFALVCCLVKEREREREGESETIFKLFYFFFQSGYDRIHVWKEKACNE